MSVWLTIPSIRPAAEAQPVINLWRQQGYNIALLRQGQPVVADFQISTPFYLGYPHSVNMLVHHVLDLDPGAEWFVIGGDDYEPDLCHPASEIAAQCNEYFRGTFGVMQPTGDRWQGACIETAAASGWMGRSWCRRMYQGAGPMWPGYRHYYADTELQAVAEYRNVYWKRRDLIQLHQHWSRYDKPCPDYMQPLWNNESHENDRQTYNLRRAAVFPGHAPLEWKEE